MRKVLFLCIGNSCRSQMAEGFAKAYGGDVMRAESAGLSPATYIMPLTKQVMAERNVSLEGHFPKPMNLVDTRALDLIVNMSGMPLVRDPGVPVEEWRVEDPVGQSIEKYREVVLQIEQAVMHLILRIRQAGLADKQAANAAAPEPEHKPRPKFGRPRIPRA